MKKVTLVFLFFVSSSVKASLCKEVEGIVTSFNSESINLKTFDQNEIKILRSKITDEQFEFFKSSISRAVKDCVPQSAINSLKNRKK